MEREPGMKVVGGKNLPSYWERFDRLQRTAQALLGRPVSPKGVFRFKTFEEFNDWKETISQGGGVPASVETDHSNTPSR
jgi:hypothetical protein